MDNVFHTNNNLYRVCGSGGVGGIVPSEEDENDSSE